LFSFTKKIDLIDQEERKTQKIVISSFTNINSYFLLQKKKIDLTASDFCYAITKENERRGKLLSYVVIYIYYFIRILFINNLILFSFIKKIDLIASDFDV
jgi:hypothetical protein